MFKPQFTSNYDETVTQIENKLEDQGAYLRDLDQKRQETAAHAVDVRNYEEEKCSESNAKAIELNAELDTQIKQLKTDRQDSIKVLKDELDQHRRDRNTAGANASKACSEMGLVFKPDHPDADAIASIERKSLEIIASQTGHPLPDFTSVKVADNIALAMVVVVGCTLGISLGIVSHVVQPDTLLKYWPISILSMVIGCGIAMSMKFALRSVWYVAAEYLTLPDHAKRGKSSITTAIALSLAFLIADMTLENRGILALVLSQASVYDLANTAKTSPSLADNVLYWAIAAIVSIGLIVSASCEGFLLGRANSVKALLPQLQQKDYDERLSAHLANPLVHSAICAVLICQDINRRIAEVQALIEETVKPFDDDIATLEGRRFPENHPLSSEAERRIQNAISDANTARKEFENALDAAKLTAKRHVDRKLYEYAKS